MGRPLQQGPDQKTCVSSTKGFQSLSRAHQLYHRTAVPGEERARQPTITRISSFANLIRLYL